MVRVRVRVRVSDEVRVRASPSEKPHLLGAGIGDEGEDTALAAAAH